MRSARCDLGLAGDQTKMFSRVQHTPRQGGGCCLSAERKLSTRTRLFCLKMRYFFADLMFVVIHAPLIGYLTFQLKGSLLFP